MLTLRELTLDETALACPALHELRPHVATPEQLALRVSGAQRGDLPAGRLLHGGRCGFGGVAGFRTLRTLAWGHILYVDNLVTHEARRYEVHAGALLRWLVTQAQRLGCEQLRLDSGVQRERETAHRF